MSALNCMAIGAGGFSFQLQYAGCLSRVLLLVATSNARLLHLGQPNYPAGRGVGTDGGGRGEGWPGCSPRGGRSGSIRGGCEGSPGGSRRVALRTFRTV